MPDSKGSPSARFDLPGKVVVVTGGCGILGTTYCARLAEAGASVVVADLNQTRCSEVAKGLSVVGQADHLGLAVDLANEGSVISWADAVKDRYGSIDVLLNNAAAKSPNFFAPLEEFPLEDWNAVMSVNLTAMFLTIRELGPGMAEKGRGSIINVSSTYGLVGPDQRIYEGSHYADMGGSINTPLIYSASKGAVLSLTRYLATYWGHRGVRTNALVPGGVYSGQNDVFVKNYSSRVPLGRMATAEDLVGAVLYLASDASAYVNGHVLVVDGGWTAW